MKLMGRNFIVALALVVAFAVGGGFYLYNEKQQMTEQQASASLDQGIALFREKKYPEALELFLSIPDGVITDWHLPYYTATAQVMLKDYQPAALKLEEALVLNPQEPQILFELGVVYYKLGKLGLSKGYFASVLEIDPTNADAKGLMDIMANLERKQPGASNEETPQSDISGADGY
jgi:tetratricopeptide (TPR) repeat protein